MNVVNESSRTGEATSPAPLPPLASLLAALPLLAAVVGGRVGVELRISEGLAGTTAWLLLLLSGVGWMLGLQRIRTPRLARVVLVAFGFFVGVMLSLSLVRLMGFYNTGNAVMTVFSTAAAVLLAAAGLGRLGRPSLPLGLQLVLTVGAAALVLTLAAYLLRSSLPQLLTTVAMGAVLGGLLLNRLHTGTVSSAPCAAVGAYLRLMGAFEALLPLFGRTDPPKP